MINPDRYMSHISPRNSDNHKIFIEGLKDHSITERLLEAHRWNNKKARKKFIIHLSLSILLSIVIIVLYMTGVFIYEMKKFSKSIRFGHLDYDAIKYGNSVHIGITSEEISPLDINIFNIFLDVGVSCDQKIAQLRIDHIHLREGEYANLNIKVILDTFFNSEGLLEKCLKAEYALLNIKFELPLFFMRKTFSINSIKLDLRKRNNQLKEIDGGVSMDKDKIDFILRFRRNDFPKNIRINIPEMLFRCEYGKSEFFITTTAFNSVSCDQIGASISFSQETDFPGSEILKNIYRSLSGSEVNWSKLQISLKSSNLGLLSKIFYQLNIPLFQILQKRQNPKINIPEQTEVPNIVSAQLSCDDNLEIILHKHSLNPKYEASFKYIIKLQFSLIISNQIFDVEICSQCPGKILIIRILNITKIQNLVFSKIFCLRIGKQNGKIHNIFREFSISNAGISFGDGEIDLPAMPSRSKTKNPQPKTISLFHFIKQDEKIRFVTLSEYSPQVKPFSSQINIIDTKFVFESDLASLDINISNFSINFIKKQDIEIRNVKINTNISLKDHHNNTFKADHLFKNLILSNKIPIENFLRMLFSKKMPREENNPLEKFGKQTHLRIRNSHDCVDFLFRSKMNILPKFVNHIIWKGNLNFSLFPYQSSLNNDIVIKPITDTNDPLCVRISHYPDNSISFHHLNTRICLSKQNNIRLKHNKLAMTDKNSPLERFIIRLIAPFDDVMVKPSNESNLICGTSGDNFFGLRLNFTNKHVQNSPVMKENQGFLLDVKSITKLGIGNIVDLNIHSLIVKDLLFYKNKDLKCEKLDVEAKFLHESDRIELRNADSVRENNNNRTEPSIESQIKNDYSQPKSEIRIDFDNSRLNLIMNYPNHINPYISHFMMFKNNIFDPKRIQLIFSGKFSNTLQFLGQYSFLIDLQQISNQPSLKESPQISIFSLDKKTLGTLLPSVMRYLFSRALARKSDENDKKKNAQIDIGELSRKMIRVLTQPDEKMNKIHCCRESENASKELPHDQKDRAHQKYASRKVIYKLKPKLIKIPKDFKLFVIHKIHGILLELFLEQCLFGCITIKICPVGLPTAMKFSNFLTALKKKLPLSDYELGLSSNENSSLNIALN